MAERRPSHSDAVLRAARVTMFELRDMGENGKALTIERLIQQNNALRQLNRELMDSRRG